MLQLGIVLENLFHLSVNQPPVRLRSNMKAAGFCVLVKIAIITTAVISNSIVEKCLTGDKTSLSSELLSTSCCLHNKTDWLVRDSEGQFRWNRTFPFTTLNKLVKMSRESLSKWTIFSTGRVSLGAG